MASMPASAPASVEVQPRTTAPVKFWALIGCLLWWFQIFILIKWLTGPFFTPVQSGPDSPPALMKVAIIVVMVGQGLAFVGLAHVWVVRPLRRDRRLGFDGMMFISFFGFYWFWDPIGNYYALTSSYNAWIPNMGSWVNGIPGWQSPGSPGKQIPEPWLVTGVGYAVVATAMVVLSCWIMRQVRVRRPRIGTWGLIGIVFALMYILETCLEVVGARVGVWAYGGTSGLPTLFPSHYYRYRLTESLWGGAIAAVAYMRWSIDDRGGIDRRARTARRQGGRGRQGGDAADVDYRLRIQPHLPGLLAPRLHALADGAQGLAGRSDQALVPGQQPSMRARHRGRVPESQRAVHPARVGEHHP
jgi:hypothetical protein